MKSARGLMLPILLMSLTDWGFAATFTVTTTADSGAGSLRQAILDSNTSVGVHDTIVFDIPPDDPGHLYYPDDGIAGHITPTTTATTATSDDGAIAGIDPDWPHSWWSIHVQAIPPEITDPLTIDGYTQPGAVENTNPTGQGLNNILRIEIDGTDTQDLLQLRFGFFRVTAGKSVIRGLAINRVDGPKIVLDGVSTIGDENRIEGNYLGPDISGLAALPPVDSTETSASHTALTINSSTGNLVGGLDPSARNLISANNGSIASGIVLGSFRTTGNRIEGNLIGPDRTGMRSISSTQSGIELGGVSDNLIGGTDPGAANVISGNVSGVYAAAQFGGNAQGNTIEGNLIGLAVDGVTDLGNSGAGVAIGNGGKVVGNSIAYNAAGVTVFSGTANLITQNSIFENEGLGIDLDSVFGTNDIPPDSDPPDQDIGNNNLQNYPVLSSVTGDDSGVMVEGFLQSTPNSNFLIEFFANGNRDPSGFGEGQTFLGSVAVVTDSNGNANILANFPGFPLSQPFVTATATDVSDRGFGPANDTSQFSPSVPLGGCAFTVTTTKDSGLGSLREAINCAEIEPGSQTIDFNIPPDDPGHVYYRDDGVAGQVTEANIAITTAADDANIADIDPDWPHSWFSILPNSDLPGMTETIFIDGYSQPGSKLNTVPSSGGLDTILKIEIDGTNGSGHGLDMGLRPSGFSRHRIRGLAINRWPGNGIVLDSWGTNTVSGCFIGTDVSGTLDKGNGENGIYLSNDPTNVIGGLDPADRNLISANHSDGIEIALFSFRNKVLGNLIGANRKGEPSLSNGENGVLIDESSSNSVGGIEEGAGNRIAFGDGGDAIRVVGSGDGGNSKSIPFEKLSQRISPSTVPTFLKGLPTLTPTETPTQTTLVIVTNTPTFTPIIVVTGTATSEPTEGMTPSGTVTQTTTSSPTSTSTNSPTDTQTPTPTSSNTPTETPTDSPTNTPTSTPTDTPSGTPTPTATGSQSPSPTLSSTPTPSPTPVPTSSKGAAQDNALMQTLIYFDMGGEIKQAAPLVAKLGIDLGGDGVTENDGDDPNTPGPDPDSDTGSNGLQNYPELQSAVSSEGSTEIGGVLFSRPNTSFRLEFFSTAECLSNGHGPAEVFLGFDMVMTDENGMATIETSLPVAVTPGHSIVSTATRLIGQNGGETSEFSACVLVTGDGGPPCPQPYPDFNEDERVDAIDLLMLLSGIEGNNAAFDLTEDLATNEEDLWEFSLSWERPDCTVR